MKYTVVWLPDALNELTELWMAAADRNAVSLAAAQIDQALGTAPLQHGESREDQTRILIAAPLAVEYELNEDDRIVQVNAVWQVK